MQESLDIVWRLRAAAFVINVCLSVFDITNVICLRRRFNRKTPQTGPGKSCPTVYTAYPKAFDFVWISHVLVVEVSAAAFFIAGLVYASNGGIADSERGDLFGSVAGAFQLYRSLSGVSQ
jgi:hypothetical protein